MRAQVDPRVAAKIEEAIGLLRRIDRHLAELAESLKDALIAAYREGTMSEKELERLLTPEGLRRFEERIREVQEEIRQLLRRWMLKELGTPEDLAGLLEEQYEGW